MQETDLAGFFDDYYIFGDSLSDVDNFTGVQPEAPIPRFTLYFEGRFTNGLEEGEGVWTDYFTDELDLELSSFYQGGIDEGEVIVVDGINFALGGDTSGSESASGASGFGLSRQIDEFVNLVDIGVINSLEGSLIVNWIGANDYLLAALDNPDSVDTSEEVDTIVNGVVTNITNSLTTVLDFGADVIVVPNLLDLSLTPLAIANEATESLQELSIAHNQALEISLDNLRVDYPHVKIIEPDIYTLFNEMANSFEHSTQGATETNIYPTDLTPIVLDPRLFPEDFDNYEEISEEAEDFLFWDTAHPTTEAHRLVADYILEILESALIIQGSSDGDLLEGENGREKIFGRRGEDTISGGTGNDTIQGGPSSDLISGDEGNDSVNGDSGDDTINGNDGNDTLRGSKGDDLIEAGIGSDWLLGGSGNDTINGENGDDTLFGSFRDDLLTGDEGNDSLIGGSGNDELFGGSGDDTLKGGPGDDVLLDEEGDNLFFASTGNESFTGGDDEDTVKYPSSSDRFFTFEGTLESFTISSPLYGEDTLINIDFVEFTDGTFTPGELLA